MTLNDSRRRNSSALSPVAAQQRWSIPADAKRLWRGSAHVVRSKSCLSPGEPCRGSWSSDSSDSVISTDSGNNLYRVVLIGEAGVGKSTLTSIFAGLQNHLENWDILGEDTYERTITVDGEGATLIVMDTWDNKDEDNWTQDHCMLIGDAYLIVYSITDRASFEKASELRIQLRRTRQAEDIPIILVGNKCDLVRCRERVDPVLLFLTASSSRPLLQSSITSKNSSKELCDRCGSGGTAKKSMNEEWPSTKEERAFPGKPDAFWID
ncbi:GTP-binding protein GEM-like isoform X2 [Mustelus asterias]